MWVPHFSLVVLLLFSSQSALNMAKSPGKDSDDSDVTWPTLSTIFNEQQWISHMCAAQCDAFCNENANDCRSLCRNNDTLRWIVRCGDGIEQEVQSSFFDRNSFERNWECPGTCSILKYQNQNDANYIIPIVPVVVLVRDLLSRSLTLTWSRVNTPSTIVYVVHERGEHGSEDLRHWAQTHLVMGGDHFTRSDLNLCSKPTYRVAAVSRYGSYWFSQEVTSPDMMPSLPRMMQMHSIHHNGILKSFEIIIKWLNPSGWKQQDLHPDTPFSWKIYINCPSSFSSVNSTEDTHYFSDDWNMLTFYVPDYAVGCKIIYVVSAISRCGEDLVSDRAYLSMDLSCQSVQELYSGELCTPPPFSPPGSVEIVHITAVPGRQGARAHVTWLPPIYQGSTGRIGFYTVYYGFVDKDWDYFFKDNVYGNITVPPGVMQVDIPIWKSWNSGDKFGVMVMARADGQQIDSPVGIMHIVHTAFPNGRVLLDEEVVVYQTDDPPEIQVYWNPPAPPKRDVTGVALQWGHVSQSEQEVSVGGGTYNWTGQDVVLYVENTTVVDENQTSFSIQGLMSPGAYGIRMLMLFDYEDEDDISEEDWDLLPIHIFALPTSSTTTGTTLQKVVLWTSKKPKPSQSSAVDKKAVATATSVPLLLVAALVLVTVLLWCRWRRSRKLSHLTKLEMPEFRPYTFLTAHHRNNSDDQEEQQHIVADEWEMPHSCIKVGRVLGSGAFGQVLTGKVSRALLRHRGLPSKYSAVDREDDRGDDPLMAPVAIKMLKEDCDDTGKAEFLREIKLMKKLGHHPHVVSMLGCCTLREPYCLLVEHMQQGDLLNYLKNIRQSITENKELDGHYQNQVVEHVSPLDLLSFARQIALGMEFLSDRGYVHRDLAARNVLIGGKNEVKVGDFGLARYVYTDRVYINRKGGKLPLKWMAIESIFDLTFSSASDVWSFGVVLFEIVTLGGTPYPTVHVGDLLRTLREGYRMERPDNCSEEMYRMMQACWRESPGDRPSFLELRHWLEEMMQDCSGVQYLDMDLNPSKEYYTCPDYSHSDFSNAVETSPPISALLDSSSRAGFSENIAEEVEVVSSTQAQVRRLTLALERDALANEAAFDIIVHKEFGPQCSSSSSLTSGSTVSPTCSSSSSLTSGNTVSPTCSSSSSLTSGNTVSPTCSSSSSLTSGNTVSPCSEIKTSVTGKKSVRFDEKEGDIPYQPINNDGDIGNDNPNQPTDNDVIVDSDIRDQGKDSDAERDSDQSSLPSASENQVLKTIKESCSPTSSLDASWEDVFTADLNESSLVEVKPSSGQCRMYPQEQHPRGRYGVGSRLLSPVLGSEVIVPCVKSWNRSSPLDSQGESVNGSSSSGDSIIVPSAQPDLTEPSCFLITSASLVPRDKSEQFAFARAIELCSRSPQIGNRLSSQNQNKVSNLHQSCLQISPNKPRQAMLSDQHQNSLANGYRSPSGLRKQNSNTFDVFRRPMMHSKPVSIVTDEITEVTAL